MAGIFLKYSSDSLSFEELLSFIRSAATLAMVLVFILRFILSRQFNRLIYTSACRNIRIYHKCEGRIEKIHLEDHRLASGGLLSDDKR